ncbi:MAG: cupredoxin family copper-binding protein [Gammaproteobacteria bacterium]
MYERIKAGRNSVIALSLAAATASVPALVHAGPGCMKDQRMWQSAYPHSPMTHQAANGPSGRYGYPAAQAPYMARMPAPYSRPMAARQGDPAYRAMPGRSAYPTAAAAQPTRVAVKSDSEADGESVTVRISGMRFEPENITVKPGTKVTWVQVDGMPHIISGKASGLRSNTLYSGQEYSYIFQKPGSYDYVCDLHPAMKGSVVVEEDAAGT